MLFWDSDVKELLQEFGMYRLFHLVRVGGWNSSCYRRVRISCDTSLLKALSRDNYCIIIGNTEQLVTVNKFIYFLIHRLKRK